MMRAIVIGATGAVGNSLVLELVKSPEISEITLLGRRKVTASEISASPKVKQYAVDLFSVDSYRQHLTGQELVYCTLGVGQPSKVSKEDLLKTDFECVRQFAEACQKAGSKTFTLLSAVGANVNSGIYYLKVKGMIESAIAELNFEHAFFFEPSMLVTKTNRYDLTQGIMLKIFPWIDPLLLGSLKKFRSITVEELGQCMARYAIANWNDPSVGKSEHLTWPDFRKIR